MPNKVKQSKSEQDTTSHKAESKKVTDLQEGRKQTCCAQPLKPRPEEYEEVGFSLIEVYKMFIIFYFLLFVPAIAIYEEAVTPGASINQWIRHNIYKVTTLEEYVKEHKVGFTSTVDECDYKTMSPK